LWSIARRAAQDAGRDPDALKTAVRINLEPGTSVDSVADKLEGFADSGIDEAILDAFAMFPTLDQMLDFASQVIARSRNHGEGLTASSNSDFVEGMELIADIGNTAV
jgi:alkanesulfonate monooxygenase SsuD/methylene tetrahydromethanopterin reductase-like flavin-dependent oxidoreductase (luciferase family)